jgi:DNA-directed RNA polymerase I, II, and III subunit RPABC2
MFDENDDFENEVSNENDYSEEEEIEFDPNEEEKEKEENGIKITTFQNVIEKNQKKSKKTIPILTKFEKARIKGVRLQQLAYGAKPRVDITGLKNIYEIVEKELLLRKIPFMIRRTLPNGLTEDWKLSEFEII